ncbi:helix-turn-helix domain-containing protein [Clostridium thermarum]|uniref:helix-turn-helix domain-containing protein n=1 Tax=Clostridium thermarum TaxID=1716543 RepID=UPI00111C9C09|nr:helix-turn-helix domain-containing protein [Clostridium thermarum]
MSRIAEKIKLLRIEAGMSQKTLAKKLGVAESYINEVEIGRKIVNEAMINRLSKIFNKDINDMSMSVELESAEEETMEELFGKVSKPAPAKKTVSAPAKGAELNDTWSGAFASVLKSVPVYDYNLTSVITTKLMPIQNNKVEGFAQDKVLYIQIADDDMLGYRMAKGDLAFCHYTSEVANNAICLIEHNGTRVVRQIKKLDSNKLLLLSNRGSLKTETVGVKDIKVIAKLERVEFNL